VNFNELGEAVSDRVSDIGHRRRHLGGIHLIADSAALPPYALRIKLNVYAAVQRMHAALQRRQLALDL
jgi:hypothetical protein